MHFGFRVALLLVFLAAMARGEEFVASRISGTVTDASGTPLRRVKVYCNRGEGNFHPDKPWDTTADDQGRYELTLWIEKSGMMIAKEVFADIDGYVRGESPDNISLQPGSTARLDFRLENGEVLGGMLKLPRLAWEQDDSRVFLVSGPNLKTRTINARARLTDAGGNFKTYLPPGEYVFEVLGYGGGPVKWSGVKTGQSALTLELPPFTWSEAEVGLAFDNFWNTMDRAYSYFFLKTNVDWVALKEQYRPKAVTCKNAAELATVLQEMLAPLRDVHIWIQTSSDTLPTHQSSFNYNGNRQAVLAQLVDRIECGRFAVVGRTKPDGFGYFLMVQQSAANPDNVKQAVDAICNLRDAPGFIIDLRYANGGNELLAQELAKLFCAKETVYAKQKYRSGPGHDDFGPEQPRVLSASANAYVKPVVCLVGPGAVSSGEGFVKMMKALPQVKTVGLPTRGASGNPKPFVLSQTGLTVYFSRWVDLTPDGKTFEGVGIPPDIEVNEPPSAYANSDPTLDKGLEVLREKIAAGQ